MEKLTKLSDGIFNKIITLILTGCVVLITLHVVMGEYADTLLGKPVARYLRGWSLEENLKYILLVISMLGIGFAIGGLVVLRSKTNKKN